MGFSLASWGWVYAAGFSAFYRKRGFLLEGSEKPTPAFRFTEAAGIAVSSAT